MGRVLVVDDERDIRLAMAEALEDEGYEVDTARDGAEALAHLRAVHAQVVLLDLMMPGMDGWEFRRVQRQDPELAGIPVVVISALGAVKDLDAQDYIQKPFELDQLLSVVGRHVV